MRREDLPTPALVLDLPALRRNIDRMAAHAAAAGVRLRPHAKSHKCVEIARLLAAAGALGPACATVREAEAMAAGGIAGILLTSPVVTADGLARLGRLLARGADLAVVVDDPANVADLAAVAEAAGRRLPVLVELDVGQGRTGCAGPAAALGLARAIAARPLLALAGVQAYWGHLQQVVPLEERARRVAEGKARVREALAGLEAAGLAAGIVTGGGTGTAFLDPPGGPFTEIQPGSFLFLDSCYGPLPLDPADGGNPFEPALFVRAAVVSRVHPGRAVVNAGLKAFATDTGRPVPVRGAPEGSTYRFMGDEHGAVEFDLAVAAPPLGAGIELLTSHCDPTVNLHDRYAVVDGGEVVDSWPIARGF
jgi:3-hydroxy-D-aspartate aldolase